MLTFTVQQAIDHFDELLEIVQQQHVLIKSEDGKTDAVMMSAEAYDELQTLEWQYSRELLALKIEQEQK